MTMTKAGQDTSSTWQPPSSIKGGSKQASKGSRRTASNSNNHPGVVGTFHTLTLALARMHQPPGPGAAAARPPPGDRRFFMPAPGHHRPPPADADRPLFIPPPAPPGRNNPPADRPHLPMPSSRPPRAYDYDQGAEGLRHPHPPPRPSSALASCLVATAFLLLSAGGAGAALFLLFRPRPPDIAVAAVRLPSFAAGNGTVAFTFEQTAAVRNPNRSPLAHFDSSLRVAYAGGELGAVYIPAGLIDGGRTTHVSASFAVPAIPVAAQAIEVDSLLVFKGRVKVLRVLTHNVQAVKVCRVGLSPLDGTVLDVRC